MVSKLFKIGTAVKKGQYCRQTEQICFRLDNDIRERLRAVANKGRFINDAIRENQDTPDNV